MTTDSKSRFGAIFGVLAAALAVGGVSAWFAHHNDEHSVMLDACEEVLLKRLRSPSTYQLVEASEIRRSIAEEDDFFYAGNLQEKLRQIRERNRDHAKRDLHEVRIKAFRDNEPDRLTMIIHYDASNGFGVPIRGTSECVAFHAPGEKLRRSTRIEARLDGLTAAGWAINALREVQE